MATYYVDSNISVSGDGSTPETAKKTIGEAMLLLTTEGDTLRFVGGSMWRESFTPPTLNNITFEAYGAGNNPILRKATVLTPGTWAGPDGNGCYTYASPGTVSWFAEDGHAMKKSSGPTIPEGNGYWYQDGTFDHTLYCKASDGLSPATHTTETLSVPAINNPAGTATYMTIDGLNFLFGGIGFYEDRNLSNLLIKNCIFDESWNIALQVNAGTNTGHLDDVIIQDNTFNACMSNIYVSATGSGYNLRTIVRRNTVAKSNLLYDGTTPWFPDGTGDYDGISIQTIKDAIIELNNISGRCGNAAGYAAGISCWVPTGLTMTGNIIRRNFLKNLWGTGITWTGMDAAGNCQILIHDNIISNFGTAGAGTETTPSGLNLAKAQTASGSGIYNNTIRTGPRGVWWQSQADYYTFRNNLIAECTYAVVLEGGWGSNMVSDHNCYHPADGNNFLVGGVEKTLGEYQAIVTPDDSTPVTSDPLFTNAGGSYALDTDFQLQSGSPAINAGVDVGLTTDYGGESIVGVPDIGAWEFGGGFRKIYIGGLQCNLTVI